MAQCAYCKAETYLYDGGVPICIPCSDTREATRKSQGSEQRVRTALMHDLVETTAQGNLACEAFEATMHDIPSGLPHPDGTQRIHNASRELDAARKEMMKAHTRLNDFIGRGIVPEDLKRSG